jgi:hypothetical protein
MAIKPWIVLIACVCLAGCDCSPDQQMIGAWTTNRRLSKIPDVPYFGKNSKFRNGLYAIQLKLTGDHTFVLAGLRQFGGTWSYEKGVLTLTPAKDAQPSQWKISSEIHKLTVSPDFSRMTASFPMPFGTIELVLDKTA